MSRFADRQDAGRQLASLLGDYADRTDVLVLALPRGGVPVAFEVARALHAPLDLCLVRKLGVPGNEELAMGAIASGGIQVFNDEVIEALQIPEEAIAQEAGRERRELERRERLYRGDRPPPDVAGKTVILIDDGLATGSTMRAAVAALRTRRPAKLVIAVPVGSPETCALLRREADEVVCHTAPDNLSAIGFWYDDFTQTTDDEVRALLARGGAS